MKENIFLLSIWRLASLLAIIFFILYFYDVQKMIETDSPKKYLITEVSLRKRYSSSVGIEHNNKYYRIELKKKEVLNYNIGDPILLYYNEQYDYFYVPNTLEMYLRYIYASVFSLFLSFIPWIKIKAKMVAYNKPYSSNLK